MPLPAMIPFRLISILFPPLSWCSFSLQALPMVTLIVGKRNGDKSTANITTCCDGVDEPKSIQVDLKGLQPGQPK